MRRIASTCRHLVTDLAAERPDEAQAVVLEALTRFPDNVRLHLQAAEGYSPRQPPDVSSSPQCRCRRRPAQPAGARSRLYSSDPTARRSCSRRGGYAAIAPNHAAARLQEIRLAVLENEPERALTLVDDLLQKEDKHERLTIGRALLYRADIHEKTARHDEEWRDLSRGQAIFGQIEQERGFDGEAYLRMVQHQTDDSGQLACRTTLSQCPATPLENALVGRPPVFMFGFPAPEPHCAANPRRPPNLTSTDSSTCSERSVRASTTSAGTPVEQLSDAQFDICERCSPKRGAR